MILRNCKTRGTEKRICHFPPRSQAKMLALILPQEKFGGQDLLISAVSDREEYFSYASTNLVLVKILYLGSCAIQILQM